MADYELEIMEWVRTLYPQAVVSTESPGIEVDISWAHIRVRVVGGPGGQVHDYPEVDIDVFGPTRERAYAVCEGLHTELLAAPLNLGGAIDTVMNRVRPRRLPWDNPRVRRYGATYELSARRR